MLKPTINIAHITAHVGGGVGAVLMDFFLSGGRQVENSLFCLDRCESNFEGFPCARVAMDGLAIEPFEACWAEILEDYDIVLIHYWNHPLMARFLATTQLPPCRLMAWSHNSGLHEPHIIPNYLARMARKLLFTSQCSMQAPNIEFLGGHGCRNIGVVHSTRSLGNFEEVGRKRNNRQSGRILLYVGTVSKAKMHPDSARIFAELSRRGFSIRVVGGPDHEALAAEVASFGGHVEIYGPVQDVIDFYREADVFIYPLRSDHYGTGEQVVLEAMASGLPVVAFANPAEKVILERGGGVLVSSTNQFIEATGTLIADPVRLQDMSRSALSRVQSDFSAEKMTVKLVEHCRELLDFEKAAPDPAVSLCGEATELGLYALNSFFDEGVYESIVQSPGQGVDVLFSRIKPHLADGANGSRWLGRSKSTPGHYLRYSPNSDGLRQLVEKIQHEVEAFA